MPDQRGALPSRPLAFNRKRQEKMARNGSSAKSVVGAISSIADALSAACDQDPLTGWLCRGAEAYPKPLFTHRDGLCNCP